jgi:hypothetical protein
MFLAGKALMYVFQTDLIRPRREKLKGVERTITTRGKFVHEFHDSQVNRGEDTEKSTEIYREKVFGRKRKH